MKRFSIVSAVLLIATSAFGSGFQLTAQGSRAMGMGMAYTAVASDSTAIYYNPAGLAFLDDKGEVILGAMWAKKLDFSFTPSGGIEEEGRTGDDIVPQIYASQQFGPIRAGIGVNTPFGLPVKWESSFSGRSIAYTALLRTLNVNPTISGKAGNFAWGVGADYMLSKVQLQRSLFFGGPEAQAKLSTELRDNSAWGWNAGVLWRLGIWRLGASYRSQIQMDHDLEVTAYPSGVPAIDTALAATLTGPATVDIEFPASLNLGVAVDLGNTIVAVDVDRTDWASFDQLTVLRGTTPILERATRWQDAWAYRLGVERQFANGGFVLRAGIYRDETPQPSADVGPILPDANRTGYSLGISIGAPGGWIPSIDISDVYVKFQDRSAAAVPTNLATRTLGMPAGTYQTTGNELSVNAHWTW